MPAIIPIKNNILVYDMYFGEQVTKSGIIMMDDNLTDRGIHPRWAKVYAVGPTCKLDVKPEQWILIEHGRWSRGIDLHDIDPDIEYGKTIVRQVDPKACLMVTDTDPEPKSEGAIGPIGA